MGKQTLTVSMMPYDRVQPLIMGYIPVEGLQLKWLDDTGEEGFRRIIHTQELDVCEFPMSSYLALKDKGGDDLTAIPVFSRMFWHGAIYVNEEAGISEPRDLIGKKVGITECQSTAALWIRAILQHEYGVKPQDVRWHEGPLEQPVEQFHRDSTFEGHSFPVREEDTLNRMLVQGKIDALVSTHAPSAFKERNPKVRRLFQDPKTVEQEYYRKTGFFPIMDTLVMRSDLLRRSPWIGQNLLKAFQLAKDLCLAELAQSGAPKAVYPWLGNAVEEVRNLMGVDYIPYGVRQNEEILQAMVQYAYEQGSISRMIPLEELFFPTTMDEFKV